MALQRMEMAFFFVAVCLHLYCDMVVAVGLQGYGLYIIRNSSSAPIIHLSFASDLGGSL